MLKYIFDPDCHITFGVFFKLGSHYPLRSVCLGIILHKCVMLYNTVEALRTDHPEIQQKPVFREGQSLVEGFIYVEIGRVGTRQIGITKGEWSFT